ncbi:MAG TPA: hypothetical protein DDW50_09650 [Firmicutes bacterium]|jgi:uncharacterized protein|nr:hypothetical protein [Bacillota bacterium]
MTLTNFRIIIDADACPKNCLQIIEKLSGFYHYEVITVASFDHQIHSPNHYIVGNESQAADIMVSNLTHSGDIIVTQDWGLAAIVLAKNAKAISPTGKIFESTTIDLLLEERDILAKHRRSGGRTKGPSKRNKNDDQNFENNLRKLITEIIG